MSKRKLKLALVNLISPDHLVRYQAPLAINVLTGYVKEKHPEIEIEKIDMQEIFKHINKDYEKEICFKLTTESVISKLIELSKDFNLIIGMSMKWSTKNVTEKIIKEVEAVCNSKNNLFILGNIESTYGHKQLLIQKYFSDKVAIVGEGEDALVNIIEIAIQKKDDFANALHYNNLNNVAININGDINLGELVRVDLENYPNCPLVNKDDIYDEECDFHAIETSRGCPWGGCTFCAIKGQFGLPILGRKPDWKWRPFPIETVLNTIKVFAANGVRNFDIKDSEFFGPVKQQKGVDPFWETMSRAEKFAEGLIDLNKELKERNPFDEGITITHISARVDTVYVENEHEKNNKRLEIYRLLKEAGLEAVFLGIESGSKTQLKRYNKGVTAKENEIAIATLRKIGLRVEAGFILFDPLLTIDELKENLDFIERTNLFDNDSRILGTLRIQEGSPYVKLAQKHNVLGKSIPGTLTYESTFKHKEIEVIESIFNECEDASKKLIKLLSRKLRLKVYHLDFLLLKNLVNCCLKNQSYETAIKQYISDCRKLLLEAQKDIQISIFGSKNISLSNEYIEHASNTYDELSLSYC